MKIKFTDLNKINKKYLSAIKMSFSNIVKKDKFIGGKIVKNFEDKFLNYCNSKYCISIFIPIHPNISHYLKNKTILFIKNVIINNKNIIYND